MAEKNYSDDDKDGSTKVHGSAKVVMDGGTWDVHAQVKTKKTGIDGTGWGCTQLVIVDANKTPVFEVNVTKTKGAELDGVAEGSEDKTFTLLPAITSQAAMIAFEVRAQNTNGIPRSINELKDFVKNTLNDAGIGIGDLPLNQVIKKGRLLLERLV